LEIDKINIKEDLYKFKDNFRKNQINKIIYIHREKYIKNNKKSNISRKSYFKSRK